MQVADLDRWLEERHMAGLWRREHAESFKPYVWKWADIHQAVLLASEAVQEGDTSRRSIQLRTPSLGDRSSNTMWVGVQCVLPGEIATAHHHPPAATRFVIQAEPGVQTVVNGEAFPMRPGDLITTPSLSWHDHYNGSDQPAMWIDGLDAQLAQITRSLAGPFSQPQQPIQRPVGYSARTLGLARPSSFKPEQQPPPFRYAWEETYAALMALKESESEGDPHDGIKLTYTHPLTKGPTLPSLACEIQLLTSRQVTKAHRHSSTTIYHVFRGNGATVADGETLEWSQGDFFILPPWTWHHHENQQDGDTILFALDDWPAMKALGLYLEEPR